MPFQWINPEFRFHSARDWQQVPSDDVSRLQLFCPETHTVLTLSMDNQAVPAAAFESTAQRLLESRKKAYVDGVRRLLGPTAELDLQYTGERVLPHSSGAAYEVAYEALHAGHSFLGFLGYVTTRKIVNLFVDTRLAYVAGRRGMYQEVVSSFEVVLP